MIYYSAYRYMDEEIGQIDPEQEYVQVNCAGMYELGKEEYCVTRRRHGRRDYLLIYTHEGCAMAKLGGSEQYTEAGTVYVYPPGTEQFYGQIRGRCTKCYWICFSGYGVADLLGSLGFIPETILETGVSQQMAAIFENLIRELLDREEHYEIHTSILMQQLLYKVMQLAGRANGEQRREVGERIRDSVNYINRNYREQIRVSRLAERSGLSVSRYIQIFREEMGCAPKEYLMHIRLEKACGFLRYTNLTVKEISAMTGFEDQLYFSRVFRKYQKCSPTEYRKIKGEHDGI